MRLMDVACLHTTASSGGWHDPSPPRKPSPVAPRWALEASDGFEDNRADAFMAEHNLSVLIFTSGTGFLSDLAVPPEARLNQLHPTSHLSTSSLLPPPTSHLPPSTCFLLLLQVVVRIPNATTYGDSPCPIPDYLLSTGLLRQFGNSKYQMFLRSVDSVC